MAKFYSLVVALMLCCIVGTNCQDCSSRQHMKEMDCCKSKSNSQLEQCLQKVYDQWNQFRESASKDTFDVSTLCSSNCILSTTIITSDNKVNAEETQTILENMMGPEWQSTIPNIVATCKELIDNYNHASSGNGSSEHKGHHMPHCNMAKEMLFHCVRGQVILNCPDSAWNDGEECNNFRLFVKNCPLEKRLGPGSRRQQ